jgi:hypothetical protein
LHELALLQRLLRKALRWSSAAQDERNGGGSVGRLRPGGEEGDMTRKAEVAVEE